MATMTPPLAERQPHQQGRGAARHQESSRMDEVWLAGRRWQWMQRRLPSEEDGIDPVTSYTDN